MTDQCSDLYLHNSCTAEVNLKRFVSNTGCSTSRQKPLRITLLFSAYQTSERNARYITRLSTRRENRQVFLSQSTQIVQYINLMLYFNILILKAETNIMSKQITVLLYGYTTEILTDHVAKYLTESQ